MGDFMEIFISILFGLLVFGATNIIGYFVSRGNGKRGTLSGILMLVISPIVFYATLEFVLIFDKGGFGAGIFALLYGVLFFINGLLFLIISAE